MRVRSVNSCMRSCIEERRVKRCFGSVVFRGPPAFSLLSGFHLGRSGICDLLARDLHKVIQAQEVRRVDGAVRQLLRIGCCCSGHCVDWSMGWLLLLSTRLRLPWHLIDQLLGGANLAHIEMKIGTLILSWIHRLMLELILMRHYLVERLVAVPLGLDLRVLVLHRQRDLRLELLSLYK